MSAYLLDVNVLIALSWPGHAFHSAVQTWFSRNANKGWATCPLVEISFVRLLSNPAFSPRAVSPNEALEALRHNVRHPAHQFWQDELSMVEALELVGNRIAGHQQVRDAYLVALAIRRKGKLATLDKRLINAFGKTGTDRSHLELIQ
jgi:uncharacterized protein